MSDRKHGRQTAAGPKKRHYVANPTRQAALAARRAQRALIRHTELSAARDTAQR